MARHWFLGDMSAWAMALGADETSIDSQSGKRSLVIPDASITFWTTLAGGTGDQYGDLLDALGTPITEAVADDDGEFPPVQGPDANPDVWYMYADGAGGAGPRRIVLATDLGDAHNALAEIVNDLSDQVTAQAVMIGNSLAVVNYDTGTSTWPTRPAGDTRRFAWIGPTAPPTGGDYMLDNYDIYLATTPV
jgi:hypothetical protein